MKYSFTKLKLKITTLLVVILLINSFAGQIVLAQDEVKTKFEQVRQTAQNIDASRRIKRAIRWDLNAAERLYDRDKIDQCLSALTLLENYIQLKTGNGINTDDAETLLQQVSELKSLIRPDPSTDPGFDNLRDLVHQCDIRTGTKISLLARIKIGETFYNRGKTDQCLSSLDRLSKWITRMTSRRINEEDSALLINAINELKDTIQGVTEEYLTIGVTVANGGVTQAEALSEIALSDINEYLEANGYQYKLNVNILDNQGSEETALQNTMDYHSQGIDIIIGHGWSSQCVASLDYVNENDMLLLSPSSTIPGIGTEGDNLLRVAPPDSYQAQRMADFLNLNGVSAIYILDGYGEYTNALNDACSGSIEVLGITDLPYDERDLSPQLDEAETALSEAVSNGYSIDNLAFVVADMTNKVVDAVEFTVAYDYELLNSVSWYRFDTMTPLSCGEVARLGSFAVDHGLFAPAITFDSEDPVYQSLIQRYGDATGEDIHDFSVYSYDCYWLIAEALLHADNTNAITVKDTLLELYDDELSTPMVALSYILSQVAQGSSYSGVTGDISFNEEGDRASQDYTLEGYAWIDETLTTTDYATYDSGTGQVEPLEVTQSPPEIYRIGYTASTWAGMRGAQDIISISLEDINTRQIEEETGYWFEVDLKSNYGSSDTALQNIEEFHQDGINIVNGHGWSSQCAGSLDYINNNDIMLISPSSTAPSLAIEDNLYRFCTNDLVAAKVLVKLYKELGKTAIIIMYRDDIWGEGLANALQTECDAEGITVLGYLSYPNELDVNEYFTQIEEILEAAPVPLEEIGFELVSYSEIVPFIHHLDNQYPLLNQVTWFGSDGSVMLQQIVDEVFDKARHLKIYSPISSVPRNSPEFNEINERYQELNGFEMNQYNIASYDVLDTIARIVVDHGTDPLVIKDQLESLNAYPGKSGPITLDQYGDRDGANYEIWGYGYDGEFGAVIFGDYDLATDTISMYSMPDPPELAVFNPNVWSRTKYWTYDPEGTKTYELSMKIGVFNPEGRDDTESVTVTYPDSVTTIDLTDSYELWGEQPYDNNYFMGLEVDDPVSGDFLFTVTDKQGNTETATFTHTGWITDLFDYISPVHGDIHQEGDPIFFDWSHPEQDPEYRTSLWSDIESIHWNYETFENSATYDETILPKGRYEARVDCWNRDGGAVEAYSIIWVGQRPQIDLIESRSEYRYYSFDDDTDYSIMFNVLAFVEDFEDIEYTKVALAGEEEYLEKQWDGMSDPWRLGYYHGWINFDTPETGDITVEVKTSTDTLVDSTYFDNWETTEFDWVSPDQNEYFPDSDNLEFSWSHPDHGSVEYQIDIWQDGEDWGWNAETSDNHMDYDGDQLESGFYKFRVRADYGRSSSVSYESRFVVGDPFQISNVEPWSWTQYQLGDLSEPNEYTISFRANLYAATGFDDLDYFIIRDPNGDTHTMEDSYWDSDEGDGIYIAEFQVDSALSGVYTLEASHIDYGVLTEEVFFDNWITDRYDTVSPSFKENVESPFTISWSHSNPDITNYHIQLWNPSDTVDWRENTDQTSITYTDPLEDGIYNIRVCGYDEEGGEIQARTSVWVGEDPLFYDTTVRSYHNYDPSNINDERYDIYVETHVITEDYDQISISVEAPNGETYNLDPNWDEDSNLEDIGIYDVRIEYDTPFTGDYIITADTPTGPHVETLYHDNWILDPYSDVTPEPGSYLPTSDELTFSWTHPNPEIEEYRVEILTEDEVIWDEWTEETILQYTGDPLDPGCYSYNILAENHNDDQIEVDGIFFIGTEMAINLLEVWSWNGYHVTDPATTWPKLHFKVMAHTANGASPIDSVTVTFPDTTVHTLTDHGNGKYKDDIQGYAAGDFTVTVTNTDVESITRDIYFDEWITTTFTVQTPTYAQIYNTGDPITFTWTPVNPDYEHAIHIWGNGHDIWIDTYQDTTYTYTDTLPPGTYSFAIDTWTEGAALAAFSSFTIQ